MIFNSRRGDVTNISVGHLRQADAALRYQTGLR